MKFGGESKLTSRQKLAGQQRIAAGQTQRSIHCSYDVDQETISQLRRRPQQCEQMAHG